MKIERPEFIDKLSIYRNRRRRRRKRTQIKIINEKEEVDFSNFYQNYLCMMMKKDGSLLRNNFI